MTPAASIAKVSSAPACAEFFRLEGLPLPPLPADMLRLMGQQGPGVFASPGWEGAAPLPSGASRWLKEGLRLPAAWCGLVERGVHSTAAQVALVTERYAVFLRKFVSAGLGDAAVHSLKLEGSFTMMRRMLASLDAARAWPAGKRLVIVDDDTDVFRWAWVGRPAEWTEIADDPSGWISPLVSVDLLVRAPG